MNGRGSATGLERRRSRCSATDLGAVRAAVRCAASQRWDSAGLRRVWGQVHESWLAAKAAEIGIVAGSGFALVATGSLGRRELLPHSDLDLLLVHDDMPACVLGTTAESLWYPLWDANVRLDHSVRTIPQALEVARTDILAGLALLDARHIAGDERLSARLIAGVRQQWRHGIGSRYGELVEVTQARWHRSGEVAYSAEPDVKGGRGGLRDVQLLDALAAAGITDLPGLRRSNDHRESLHDVYRTVLDVRTELHRVCGRGQDLLSAQYAEPVGSALGLGDSYDLAARLFDAAHTISRRVDVAMRVAADVLPCRGVSALRA